MELEVERIRGHKKNKRKVKYLVHFAGLTIEEDAWYPEEAIPNKKAVQDYLKTAPETQFYIEKDMTHITNDELSLLQLQYKTPIEIIGTYRKNDTLFYRVEFVHHAASEPDVAADGKEKNDAEKISKEKKTSTFYSVPSEYMKKVYPRLVCDYLEKHIEIKKPEE